MGKNRSVHPVDEIEFKDPPPAGRAGRRWTTILVPLLKHKGRWAMVATFDTPEGAQGAQSNCNKRKVRIPEPDHIWEFAARGCELYAIYRGPKVGVPLNRKPRRSSR